MMINKITNILLKIIASILIVGGMISLLKGFSPEWNGHEGGGAIGGAWQALSFIAHGIILWMVAGWAIAMYRASRTKNKVIIIFSAFMSTITGLWLLYSSLLDDNPFTRSNSKVMYLIPGELIGFLSETIFFLIGINAFIIAMQSFKNES